MLSASFHHFVNNYGFGKLGKINDGSFQDQKKQLRTNESVGKNSVTNIRSNYDLPRLSRREGEIEESKTPNLYGAMKSIYEKRGKSQNQKKKVKPVKLLKQEQ